MLILSKVKLGVTPDINALATLIIVVITVGVVIAWALTRRSQQQQT
jgi:putrescine transport system permease protein